MRHVLSIATTMLVAGVLALAAIGGCASEGKATRVRNPPAAGFDAAGSDVAAITLADSVMERMGGRDAWDSTRYVTWRFFGRRRHVWDRHTGDVRIEGTTRGDDVPYVVLMNIHTGKGRAWKGGVEVTDAGALAEMLDGGESAWINDSYWLVMPYKLKDSGVTLRSRGARDMVDGRAADVLELTFAEVGRTPRNRYDVYVARDTGLVEQWDFYADAGDEEPRFRIPWHDWERHGRILLSGNRGEGKLTGIAVFDELPASVLTSPEPWPGPGDEGES